MSPCWLLVLAAVIIPAAHAQLEQDMVTVEIDGAGDASVLHEIAAGQGAGYVRLIGGQASDLAAYDAAGGAAEYEIVDGTAELGADAASLSYRINGAAAKVGGAYSWDFSYPGTVRFAFPEGTEIAFINDTPVYVGGAADKIDCNGCSMVLSFADWPSESRTVRVGGQDYMAEIMTFAETSQLEFDSDAKSLEFDYDGAKEFVIMDIQQDLLGAPYDVLVNGNKVLNHEVIAKDNRTWLTVQPKEPGRIAVIGATAADGPAEMAEQESWPAAVAGLIIAGAVAAAVLIMRRKTSRR